MRTLEESPQQEVVGERATRGIAESGMDRKDKRINQRCRGNIRRRPRIERTSLIKENIPRNPHPMSHWIPTMIALMLNAVPKEDTLSGLCSQLSTLTIQRSNTTMKVGVNMHLATKALKRNATLKSRRRLNISQIGGSRDSLSPKVTVYIHW